MHLKFKMTFIRSALNNKRVRRSFLAIAFILIAYIGVRRLFVGDLPERLIQFNESSVTLVDVNKENSLLLAILNNGKCKLIGDDPSEDVRTFALGDEIVTAATFCVGGARILCGTMNGELLSCDVNSYESTGYVIERECEKCILQSLKADTNGNRFVAVYQDSSVGIIEIQSLNQSQIIMDGSKRGYLLSGGCSCVISADGSVIGMADYFNFEPLAFAMDRSGKTTRIELANRSSGSESGRSGSVALSGDGDLLALGTLTGDVIIWRLSNGQIAYQFTVGSCRIDAIAFSSDGNELAIGGNPLYWPCRATVYRWSLGSEQVVKTFAVPAKLPASKSCWITSVLFMPVSNQIAAGYADGTIRIW